MIRFTDIVPAAEPKKAPPATREPEQAASPTVDPAKPAKAPRKPKKSV